MRSRVHQRETLSNSLSKGSFYSPVLHPLLVQLRAQLAATMTHVRFGGRAGFVKFPATPTIGLGAEIGYSAWTGKLTDLVACRSKGEGGRGGWESLL